MSSIRSIQLNFSLRMRGPTLCRFGHQTRPFIHPHVPRSKYVKPTEPHQLTPVLLHRAESNRVFPEAGDKTICRRSGMLSSQQRGKRLVVQWRKMTDVFADDRQSNEAEYRHVELLVSSNEFHSAFWKCNVVRMTRYALIIEG